MKVVKVRIHYNSLFDGDSHLDLTSFRDEHESQSAFLERTKRETQELFNRNIADFRGCEVQNAEIL